MGWTKSEMVASDQHLIDDVRSGIAGRVGALLWDTAKKPGDAA
jgi:hypothetical protein